MKEVTALLLILNVVYSGAKFLRRGEQRSSNNKNDSITIFEATFSQKLDHFNPSNDQKWDQHYWFSKQHYEKGGPVFLLINGEWSVDSDTGGFNRYWVSYAENLKALCFSLEHRFYGKSWPEKKSIRYLSTAQALADTASFITGVTQEFGLDKDQKWIVFGCSYAGVLAAWARLKYPHLIHGTVASSAPLLSKVDYDNYFPTLERSLKSYDPKCLESITEASEEIAHFVDDDENFKNISNIFDFCESNDQPEDIADVKYSLFYDIVDIFSEAVQQNENTPLPIRTVCDIMIDYNGTKLEAFAEVRKKYFKILENESDDSWNQNAYSYQICSEIGGFISNGNKTVSIFTLGQIRKLERTVKNECREFFGPNFGVKEMDEKMSHANMLYGGLNFNIGNTLFIHGSLDPWHTYGLYKTTNGSLFQTIFINGTSHCADTYSTSDEDITELRNAREEALKILKIWLKK